MAGQKLELTWVGKNKPVKLEPRLLLEVPEKSYCAKTKHKGDIFDNMLIHGDNLLALKALESKFAGQVKCVYIDPPYNTGAAFDHYDDNMEHSIWLGLMKLRLISLRNLLSSEGSIWISIDDSEQAYLKLLCDEVFGRENFIANLPTIMNLKGNQDEFGFAGTHEYTIVYAKDKSKLKLNLFPIDEEDLSSDWLTDAIGFFKKGATLKRTGADAPRGKRPYGFFPILIGKNLEVQSISEEEFSQIYNPVEKTFDDAFVNELKMKYEKLGYSVILPTSNDEKTSWRWGFDKVKRESGEIIVLGKNGDYSLYKKQRPEIGELPSKKPKSLFYKPQYSSGNGTNQIKALFGTKAFDYPKPEELLADFLTIATNEGDLVLDSFLGSGTSAAVAHKMHRRWIGIELMDHCYSCCIPRLQKVVDGEDKGGVTKQSNWQGGGGFRFYELAPSLIKKDAYGVSVIDSEKFDEARLAEAVCKIMGFTYKPSAEEYFIHGQSTENAYIYVTTNYMTAEHMRSISQALGSKRYLSICCKAFEDVPADCENLNVQKIPKAILDKCEWGKDDYSLNVKNLPMADSVKAKSNVNSQQELDL